MNKKTRNHSICEKKPYIAVVLGLIIPSVIVGIGSILGDKVLSNGGDIAICVFAVIAMLLFRFWFSPEFKGFVKIGCSSKDLCILMIPWGLLVIFTLIAHGYYRLRGIRDKVSAPALLCSCMPNNGFIGYPVALVFMGNKGLLLMIAHGAIVFNVYVFTYAINFIRSSNQSEKLPMTKERLMTLFLQVLLNPNIIAIVIGMTIYAFTALGTTIYIKNTT